MNHFYSFKIKDAAGIKFDCGKDCLKKIVLLAPYVCFHSFSKVKVTEWPPIGKIAAHLAYDMFHGIST